MSAWDANDPALAAPLDRRAELLGVDLATLCTVAADVEPYLWVDGTKVWSLIQLERRLRRTPTGASGAATSAAGASRPRRQNHPGYRNGSPSPNPGRLG